MEQAIGTRHLFITGITSGIGQEVMRLALADGFQVTATVRDERQKQELSVENQERLTLHSVDLRQRNAVCELGKSLAATPFSHVLLNAGYAELGKLHELDRDKFADMLEANLIGHVLLLQRLLPQCLLNQTRVCLVSSLVAHLPGRRYAAYGMAKAGISYLAESLALDYPMLRVLCVELGGVNTPFHQKCRSGFNVKHFKDQEETGRRLYRAMLTRRGVTTLYWDWTLARWFLIHFRSAILMTRRWFNV